MPVREGKRSQSSRSTPMPNGPTTMTAPMRQSAWIACSARAASAARRLGRHPRTSVSGPLRKPRELSRQKSRKAGGTRPNHSQSIPEASGLSPSGVSAGQNCSSVSAEHSASRRSKLANERSETGIPAVCVDLSSIAANCLRRRKAGNHHRYSQRTIKFQGGHGLVRYNICVPAARIPS
jgi:hypothetical protein